jgi:hypothetical protein
MRPSEEFGNSFTRSQPWGGVVLNALEGRHDFHSATALRLGFACLRTQGSRPGLCS